MVMIREWRQGSSLGQYFSNMPLDIVALLNQNMYDMHWHQGEKHKSLEAVLSLVDAQEAQKEREKMLANSSPSTRSFLRRDVIM